MTSPNVDPHRGIYHLELVDERDVDAPKNVLQQLGRLSRPAAANRDHRLDRLQIQRFGFLQTSGCVAADYLGDLGHFAAGVAWILTLRTEG